MKHSTHSQRRTAIRPTIRLLSAAILAVAPFIGHAGERAPFTLKGFTAGQPMPNCPAGWRQNLKNYGFECVQSGGTIASRPTNGMFIDVSEGRIVRVLVDLKAPSDWVHVQAALSDKYGPPPIDHGASRAWVSVESTLSVNELGMVQLSGRWQELKRAAEAKGDL